MGNAGGAATAHLIEEDVLVREPLKRALTGRGWQVRTHDSLSSLTRRTISGVEGCLLLGRCPSDPDGWESASTLVVGDVVLPVILLPTHGSLRWAVSSSGDEPVVGTIVDRPDFARSLEARLRHALGRVLQRTLSSDDVNPAAALPEREQLTAREAEVRGLLAAGLTTRAAGRALGISHLTIEVHRANIARKIGIDPGGWSIES